MTRYINPYTDFGFKKLFGEEASKDLLLDFLNQVLPDGRRVAELTFKSPEGLPEIASDRKAVFDIFCKSPDGEWFIVEMQKARQEYFKDRALFYSTFPIRAQAEKGDWNFRLAPIYCVGILNFEFNDAADPHPRGRGEERDDVLTVAKLKNQRGAVFYDKFTIACIEMPRFQLREDELKTRFQKWLYFLKNLESLDDIPAILREPVFEKGFHLAELAGMSAQERDAYVQSQKYMWDYANTIDTAHEEGKQIGIEEGKQIGIEEGYLRRKQEEQAEKVLLREKLRRMGLTDAQIDETLGGQAPPVDNPSAL